MSRLNRWPSRAALLLAIALAVSACGAADKEAGSGDIKTDKGVTSEPCPGSKNTDRGCIYLGILSDLTVGPFAPLAVPITDAQKDFWDRVNAQGGIDGKYDVNVEEYTRDNKYNPQEHVAKLREIEPEILALAQSLGTTPTLAGLPIMDENDLVAVPATWWSGWGFEDKDLVLESGYSYCGEAMNGLDYAAQEYGDPKKVLSIGYPGDYGGDSAAGAKMWGEANGAEVAALDTAPNAQAGNQDAAVGAIRKQNPDVVLLAVGPAEMAEIVGKSVAGGFKGRFMGSIPTFNQAVLQSEAAPAIQAAYRLILPWAPWGSDTAAHKAMQEALAGKKPKNDGYTYGWIWSYPLKAVLEQAAKSGDLTRAGLRKAVAETTVDYEGALPDKRYGGDATANVVRDAVIAKADPKAPLGASVEQDFFVGDTTKEANLSQTCAKAG